MRHYHLRLVTLCILVIVAAAGCKKKPATVAAPPAAPPAVAAVKPTATLSANPPSIERGQATTLSWSTTNAGVIRLEPGLGAVNATGTMTVRPPQSITYRIVAEGAGGTADASARVTVTSPPEPIDRGPSRPTEEDIDVAWPRQVKPVYFDYDQYERRADQR